MKYKNIAIKHNGWVNLVDVINFANLVNEQLPWRFQDFDGDIVEEVLDEVKHPMT